MSIIILFVFSFLAQYYVLYMCVKPRAFLVSLNKVLGQQGLRTQKIFSTREKSTVFPCNKQYFK